MIWIDSLRKCQVVSTSKVFGPFMNETVLVVKKFYSNSFNSNRYAFHSEYYLTETKAHTNIQIFHTNVNDGKTSIIVLKISIDRKNRAVRIWIFKCASIYVNINLIGCYSNVVESLSLSLPPSLSYLKNSQSQYFQ